MREVSIEGGGYYIPKLGQALLQHGGAAADGTERQLLCWGKVGRVLHRQVPPGQQHEDVEDDAELHVRTTALLHVRRRLLDLASAAAPAAQISQHAHLLRAHGACAG